MAFALGGFLLNAGISDPRANETSALLCGAVLVSLSVIGLWFALKNWRELE